MSEQAGSAARRPLVYNAFLTYALSHVHHGMWRNPATRNLDYNDLRTWIELARLLERGRFDTIFFADTLGPFDEHRGGWQTSVERGLQIPSGDPHVLVSALGAATEDLGFVFTGSVLREPPFPFARKVSSLDHLTNGRIGWNIVTSTRRAEARNLGYDDIPPHSVRYAIAEEYAQVVYRLLEDSWDDDAVVRDLSSGRYADPSKVRAIDHRGAHFRVAGPHLAEPSPQRTPVIFQAGSSELGREFAARHAEGTFIAGHDPHSAREVVDDIRRRAVAADRRADDIHFIQGITFVVGSTEGEAARLSTEVDGWLDDEGMLAHISGTIGVDLSCVDLDSPIGSHTTERTQGVVRSLEASAPERPKTYREVARWAWSQRIVGTPESIADQIERWADAGVTGFNVIHITTPGTYADFIDHVAPELQRRGLMQREYRPGTLREKLFPGRSARLTARHPARAGRPVTVGA